MFIGELLSVHQRGVEVKNDKLRQRQDLARDVVTTCVQWTELLSKMISEAAQAVESGGVAAAQGVIERQINDFFRVDYFSIHSESKLLRHLDKDDRFSEFVAVAHSFYDTAIELKRLGYANVSGPEDGAAFVGMVSEFNATLEAALRNVVEAEHQVRIVEPD